MFDFVKVVYLVCTLDFVFGLSWFNLLVLLDVS